LDVGLFASSAIDATSAEQVTALAIESYGRAYGYYHYWWGSNELDESDMWHQLLVLDGLRAIFLNKGDRAGVRLCTDTFDLWGGGEMSTLFANDGERAVILVRRFAETSGYLRGLHTQGGDVPRPQLARLNQNADLGEHEIARLLARIEREHATFAPRRIEVALGDAYAGLTDDVRSVLIDAEEAYLRSKSARDKGNAIVAWRTALAALVGDLEGADRPNLLGEYGNVSSGKLQSKLRRGAPSAELAEKIRNFTSRYGNPSAHRKRGYRPFDRRHLDEARHQVLGLFRELSEWRE
jgi:hypothetical protein